MKYSSAGTDFLPEQPERIIQFGSGNLFGKISLADMNLRLDERMNKLSVVIVNGRKHVFPNSSDDTLAVSRMLSVKKEWGEVLKCSRNEQLTIILADSKPLDKNVLTDKMNAIPPFSFPGKLLAFLFHRYQHFDGAYDKGFTIVSGKQGKTGYELLESVVLELAHLNGMRPAFLDWIENANHFRNMK
ncbi:MAG: hypothetical protein V4450_13910 [Bacteroidota bacterium]